MKRFMGIVTMIELIILLIYTTSGNTNKMIFMGVVAIISAILCIGFGLREEIREDK